MYRPHLSLLVVLIAATVAFAQTGPKADDIPACVKECDPAAIASVNCANEDQHCHCLRQEGILSNITACADRSCDDPDHDIDGMWKPQVYCSHADTHAVFTKLFNDVCRKFNISVPASEKIGPTNATNVTAEYWGGDYGGGSGGYGGGGWNRGAAGTINAGTQLGWISGSVAFAFALNLML